MVDDTGSRITPRYVHGPERRRRRSVRDAGVVHGLRAVGGRSGGVRRVRHVVRAVALEEPRRLEETIQRAHIYRCALEGDHVRLELDAFQAPERSPVEKDARVVVDEAPSGRCSGCRSRSDTTARRPDPAGARRPMDRAANRRPRRRSRTCLSSSPPRTRRAHRDRTCRSDPARSARHTRGRARPI